MTETIFTGSPRERAQANIEAIRCLPERVGSSSKLSSADRAALERFSGWGCLPDLFDASTNAMARERDQLLDLVGEDSFEVLARGVLDSHYTPPGLIQAIWNALIEAGFSGGSVLEPGCGSGYFRRFMPDTLAGRVQMTGIECDPVAAAVCKALYDDVRVMDVAYRDALLVDGSFDLVIGNVPFGQTTPHDPFYPFLSDCSLHEYFVGKSIEKLRPGGLLAVVTSRYLLDKHNSRFREWLDRRAELVGAVRLPAGAFEESAGTGVVTDVVIFRRRAQNKPSYDPDSSWVDVASLDVDGRAFNVNTLFVEHPERVCGQWAAAHGEYGRPVISVDGSSGEDLWPMVQARLADQAEGSYVEAAQGFSNQDFLGGREETEADQIEDAVSYRDGELLVGPDGQVLECVVSSSLGRRFVVSGLEGKRKERVVAMIGLVQTLKGLLEAESCDDSARMSALRCELNVEYDTFTSAHGPINARGNRLLFRDDPRYPLLAALEVDFEEAISKARARQLGCDPQPARWKKADIFSRAVNAPREVPDPSTPDEALVCSMARFGGVRLDIMAGWLEMEIDKLTEALQGKIFLCPVSGEWIHHDLYLGGNVRRKLNEARQAVEHDACYRPNVEALEQAQPEPLGAADIAAPINAPWIPGEVLAEFIERLIDESPLAVPRMVAGEWLVDLPRLRNATFTQVWGTERRPADDLIERILNDRDLAVYDTVLQDGKERRVANVEATSAARAKANEIRETWNDWVWDCPMRRRKLEAIYNRVHNTHVQTRYDGAFLLNAHGGLPGMNRNIRLRSSQVDAVWQGLAQGTVLFDHLVGAGKTFAAVALVMESIRMGLTRRKAMIVVPSHLTLQWGAEIARLYPDARVLVASRRDFEKSRRRRLFARIATGDYDMVVIGESSFKFIEAPAEARFELLSEMLSDINQAMSEHSCTGSSSYKRLQKRRAALQKRIEKIMNAPARDAVCLSQLGIDLLVIDEAHSAKNLLYFTSHRGVAGLGPSDGSAFAFDLFCKARWLQKRNNGRGLVMLTATPISNSVAELYHFQRFLCYEELRARDVHVFDNWARTYANPTSGYELNVAGQWQVVTRFQSFQNVPEMMTLYRNYAHVVTAAEVENIKGWKVPKVRGGKPELVICRRSDEQAGYQEGLVGRYESLAGKDPREDNALKILTDGRKSALDYRMIDPAAPAFADGKIHECARRIFHEWARTRAERGVQLVFCDLSTPAARGRRVRVSGGNDLVRDLPAYVAYDEIRALLEGWGVPSEEIAFVHDAKSDEQKYALQAKARQGKVRVVMASTALGGTGMNIQNRLTALHELDCPWRPSDLEQRRGRIIRPGSELLAADPHFAVSHFRYGTDRSGDARNWQIIETKARFVDQVREGSTDRVIQDIGLESSSAGEMKANLCGNPLILAHFMASSELKEMERQHKAWKRRRLSMEDSLARSADFEARRDRAVAEIRADLDVVQHHPEPAWSYAGVDRSLDDDLSKHLGDVVTSLFASYRTANADAFEDAVDVGEYRGFKVMIWRNVFNTRIVSLCGQYLDFHAEYAAGRSAIRGYALVRRFENAIRALETAEDYVRECAAETARDRGRMAGAVQEPFRQADRLKRFRQIEQGLSALLAEGAKAVPDGAEGLVAEWVSGCVPAGGERGVSVSARTPDPVPVGGGGHEEMPDRATVEVAAMTQAPVQISLFG
jgi:N12 class adenine-specific DNA methylase/predicted RNA methylase